MEKQAQKEGRWSLLRRRASAALTDARAAVAAVRAHASKPATVSEDVAFAGLVAAAFSTSPFAFTVGVIATYRALKRRAV